jgi:hypothetical protein
MSSHIPLLSLPTARAARFGARNMKEWTVVLLGIIAMLLVALLYGLFVAPDR